MPSPFQTYIEKNLDWGWEYSLDILTKLYCDNNKNADFLKWKRDHDWIRKIATNEARLERENEKLKQQCHNLQHQELEQQSQQLFQFLFPNQSYNFNQLQQEITLLKYQELAPQVRQERTNFEQSITAAKTKVGNHFEKIIDLLLETQKQREETTDTSQKDKLSGC